MRYALPIVVLSATIALIALHLVHRFPAPGARDVARLIGRPVVTLEGVVTGVPLTRWGQMRFVLRGRSVSPPGYRGRVAVTLRFLDSSVAPGDRITLRGWLSPPRPAGETRTFDEVGYWGSQGVYTLMDVWSPESLTVKRRVSPWTLDYWTWRVRQRYCAFWRQTLPESEAELIIGLTIGGRGILSPDFKTACIRAGVYHIVVVSGQNVAMVIALGLWFFRAARGSRRWAWVVAGPPIVFYAQLTGADPPVARAAVMAIYAFLVMGLRRDPPQRYGLCIAIGVFLLCWPEALFGASFQLSFAATAALMIGLPVVRDHWMPRGRVLRWLRDAVTACVVVHIGIWPILVLYFHQLSLAGVLAPFTIYPLAALCMILGMGLGAVGLWHAAWVPSWALQGLHHLLHLLTAAIWRMGQAPHAALPLLPLKEGAMLLYYLGLFGILFLLYRRHDYAQKISPIRLHRARL